MIFDKAIYIQYFNAYNELNIIIKPFRLEKLSNYLFIFFRRLEKFRPTNYLGIGPSLIQTRFTE